MWWVDFGGDEDTKVSSLKKCLIHSQSHLLNFGSVKDS